MRVLNSLSDLNVSRILRLIWLEKKISRVDIASRLSMDKSTVTKITSELFEKEMIREAESGESGPQGGRKPVFIELNGDYSAVGGIEINSEKLNCSVLDFSGDSIFEHAEEINIDEYKTLGLIGFFEKAFLIIAKFAKENKIKLAGIGVGLPGLIDAPNGKVVSSIPLGIDEVVEFSREASSIAKVPVYLDNDARCSCYTENLLFDSSSVAKNMMYVLIQHRPQTLKKKSPKNLSVGFSFILNGKIYHGANSTAGEFRSMLWNAKSKNQFSAGINNVESLEDEKAVLPVFKELSKNVAFLVNTLNIDVVYVGGLKEKYSEQIVKLINKEIKYLWPYEPNENLIVKSATIADNVVSTGAAVLVLDKLFSVPDISL